MCSPLPHPSLTLALALALALALTSSLALQPRSSPRLHPPPPPHQVTRYAKAHALEHGPIVLEMDTYRYHGHSMSDPGITYRNRDEVAGVRAARDPVARIKKYLLDLEFATEQEIKTIDMAVKKEVEAAVAAAKAAPEPPMTSLYEDIYTDQSKDFFMRGCDMSASNGVYGVSK